MSNPQDSGLGTRICITGERRMKKTLMYVLGTAVLLGMLYIAYVFFWIVENFG